MGTGRAHGAPSSQGKPSLVWPRGNLQARWAVGETTTPLASFVLFRTFSAFSTYREMKAHTGELAGLDPTGFGVSFSQPGSRRFTSVVGEFGGPPGGESSAPSLCTRWSMHEALWQAGTELPDIS